MAEYADREHYIPLRKSDLVELLCRDKQMPRTDVPDFKQFCVLISSVFHFEYLQKLESLKDLFAPFDPDTQTRLLQDPGKDERERLMNRLFEEFNQLMERANFKKLTKDDVIAAVEGGASDWGINMNVNFDVFEHLELYIRGEGRTKRHRRHKVWFWKTIEVPVDTYQRVALAVKLKPHKRLPKSIDTRGVFFKLFKDIPKLDLEMILPGTTIQMPSSQRSKFGATLLGTIAYAVYKVWFDLIGFAAALGKGLMFAGQAAVMPIAILGGYGYKQYAGYQVTRQTYAKMLTESLYYQTLDNNAGVLTHILDEAEEQECREAILAYYCLLRFAPEQGWTPEQLDDYVELYLEGMANLKVDFEIGDAIDKVERLGIVTKTGKMYRAIPLPQALEKLDYRWDNYFQYNKN
jgi:hypothetical protein